MQKPNSLNTYTLASFAIAAFSFVFTSCSPKANPVAENKTLMAERYQQGMTLFNNSCGKCHDLPNPDGYSNRDWVGIMNAMAPKAKLNEEQHELVYQYIVVAKKEKDESQD